jgi:hypothetical protein
MKKNYITEIASILFIALFAIPKMIKGLVNLVKKGATWFKKKKNQLRDKKEAKKLATQKNNNQKNNKKSK